MPDAIALFNSSGLVRATAAGPSYTTDCHKSQSTGTDGSLIADGPANAPEAVPGDRAGFIEGSGLLEADGPYVGEDISFSSETLVGWERPRPAILLPVNPEMIPFSSSPKVVMPASSRIRKSLNLSFRLFREGRLLEPSGSWVSSSLPNIISGLLLIVMIEEVVFLRSSLCGGGTGGGGEVSFVLEVFRESQENGLVKLLLAAIGVGSGDICCWGAAGGGPHGTEGRTPAKP